MTTQDLLQAIIAANPSLTEAQILDRLAQEKTKTNGLFGDETLLRLIAAKLGVQVQQNHIQNSGILPSSRLFAGLNDVTVAGRLIAIYPARSFQGAEKSGKFATLLLVDNEGILRVVLWNEKAEIVERGELKVGQVVRLLHGYTRDDRSGKTELHLGTKSLVEFEPDEKSKEYPSVDKFATKISALNNGQSNVHISGKVKALFNRKTFTKSDSTEGTVMRLTLEDDSGAVSVVVWNEKAIELDKSLVPNAGLQLINARVKEASNGGLEVHVDSTTYVNLL